MSLIVTVKVVPAAGRSCCLLDKADNLKCHLKSQPERGKANAELCALLAKAAGVGRNQVTIVTGQTSRTKRVKIDTEITFEQLLAALGIERQTSLFDRTEK